LAQGHDPDILKAQGLTDYAIRVCMGDSFCAPAMGMACAAYLANPHGPWLGPAEWVLELCCGTSVSGLSVLPLQLLHRVHIGIGVFSASLRPAPSGLGCRL